MLASAVESLAKELVGVKGHHFPDGPYVEFSGKLTTLSNEELTKRCTELMQEKIAANSSILVSEKETEENESNKKCRIVQIESMPGVPCGGTHLSNLNQLQSVTIRKINSSKGNTRIGYAFL